MEIEDGIEVIENICSDENIEESIISKEINNVLLNALNKLTEEERNIIIDIYFNGNKMKDYVETHNINYIALAKKKSKILKKLRKMIEEGDSHQW